MFNVSHRISFFAKVYLTYVLKILGLSVDELKKWYFFAAEESYLEQGKNIFFMPEWDIEKDF